MESTKQIEQETIKQGERFEFFGVFDIEGRPCLAHFSQEELESNPKLRTDAEERQRHVNRELRQAPSRLPQA